MLVRQNSFVFLEKVLKQRTLFLFLKKNLSKISTLLEHHVVQPDKKKTRYFKERGFAINEESKRIRTNLVLTIFAF